MIHAIETKKIVALNGCVILLLEECSDGVLNIQVKAPHKNTVRLGVEEDGIVHFKFLNGPIPGE